MKRPCVGTAAARAGMVSISMVRSARVKEIIPRRARWGSPAVQAPVEQGSLGQWLRFGGSAMATTAKPTRVATPPLVEGDRLDQPEFHRRYEAMPPETRAELIDGVVYMPSPVGVEHGESSGDVVTWLGVYRRGPRACRCSMAPQRSSVAKASPSPTFRCGSGPSMEVGLRPSEGSFKCARTGRRGRQGHALHRPWSQAQRLRTAGVLEYIVRAHHPDDVFWMSWRSAGW